MAAAQLGAVLQHIRTLAADPKVSEQTDGALLRAFLGHNDQAAFEALLRRHGPMVLSDCRRSLGNVHDAEEALQATFLVLARQASSIRKQESLAGWLHGVAYRMANHAKRAAARRRGHEARVSPTQPQDPALCAAWQELQVLLDEEIQGLPETLRAPFVLCCLENKSSAEAAGQLGVKEATLRMRLSRGRKLLRERLTRRGVALAAALGAVALGTDVASAAVPGSVVVSTAKAATSIAAGQAAAAGLVPPNVAALTEGMLKAMVATKRKIAAVVLLVLLLVGTGTGTLAVLRCSGAAPPPLTPQASQGAAPEASKKEQPQAADAPGNQEAKDPVTIHGRVLGPDGKPFKGAQVYVMGSGGDPTERARTDAEVRFEFRQRRGEVLGSDKRPAHTFQVVAAAEGYGPAWVDADDNTPARDVTLRLVKMDLVQVEVVAEQRPALGELAHQDGERMVLDLMFLRLDAPAGGVGVTPLGADHDPVGRDLPAGEPGPQEGLAAAVGAGGVEVADAELPGGIEHSMGPGLHRGDVVVVAQVVGVAEVDVAGPAQRRQAEAEA
jgi:RNA polymerase sigma factor (sigma-70 family)